MEMLHHNSCIILRGIVHAIILCDQNYLHALFPIFASFMDCYVLDACPVISAYDTCSAD